MRSSLRGESFTGLTKRWEPTAVLSVILLSFSESGHMAYKFLKDMFSLCPVDSGIILFCSTIIGTLT